MQFENWSLTALPQSTQPSRPNSKTQIESFYQHEISYSFLQFAIDLAVKAP